MHRIVINGKPMCLDMLWQAAFCGGCGKWVAMSELAGYQDCPSCTFMEILDGLVLKHAAVRF